MKMDVTAHANCLEAQAMWILMCSQGEVGFQVLADECALICLLDGCFHQFVNLDLILLALLRRLVFLFLFSEDVAFGLAGLLLVGSLEVGVVEMLRNGDALQVNASLCSDDIALGDATQWTAVQVERSVDEEQSGFQDLQQDNALALMTTGQEDEHLSGHQCAAGVVFVLLEVVLCRALGHTSFGGVRRAVLVDADNAGLSVLGTANFLLNNDLHL